MLQLADVEKYYANVYALRRVNLNFVRGEVVGLFGANGAGKTTLLKAAMGLIPLDRGWVTLNGEKLQKEVYEELSFITEEGSFFSDMTPRAHGEFYAGMLPRFKSDRFELLLDFFELEPTKRAGAFSRGQRAKLEIAIGMSRGADFILMDEPFSGKDIFTRRDFLKLMIAMLEPQECVVVATHQIEEIENFVTRAVVLMDGRIAADAQMDEITAECEGLSEFIRRSCGYDEGRVGVFLV